MDANFITMEGLDSSGKTLQVDLLYKWMIQKNWPCIKTREPTEGPIGKLIRQILSGNLKISTPEQSDVPFDAATMTLLFTADRQHHCQETIDPALRNGVHVISDRYDLSTFAYQTPSVNLEWAKTLMSYARSPNLILFINTPPEIAFQRLTSRGNIQEIYEKKEIQERVYKTYWNIIKDMQARLLPVIVIPGNLSIEKTHECIKHAVLTNLQWEVAA